MQTSESCVKNSENREYFDCYANLEVHETMLRDTSRNESYQKAIYQNRSRIKDKVVMDLGSGTGILAILCAQVGAKTVYAVEPSAISSLLKATVRENNFDAVIQVINKRVEDLKINDDIEKVDVIVSEWMGHYLLHEAMLESVIYARDHFLSKDGLIFPEIAKLYVAPCRSPSFFDYWDNVSGISMQSIGKWIRDKRADKPCIAEVKECDLLAEEKLIAWLDLKEINSFDQFEIDYLEPVTKSGCFQAVCLWFDCDFPSESPDDVVTLSTSPRNVQTHWKQTVIVLPVQVEYEEAGYPVAFKLSLIRDSVYFRNFNISLEMLDPNEIEHPEPCRCYFTKCIVLRKLLENYP